MMPEGQYFWVLRCEGCYVRDVSAWMRNAVSYRWAVGHWEFTIHYHHQFTCCTTDRNFGLKTCFSTMIFLFDLFPFFLSLDLLCSIMIKCFLNSLILCFSFNFFSLFSSMSSVSTSLNLWPGTTCCELRSDFILESQLSACRSANQYTNEWDFSPRKYVPAKFNRKLTWSYISHACPLLHN